MTNPCVHNRHARFPSANLYYSSSAEAENKFNRESWVSKVESNQGITDVQDKMIDSFMERYKVSVCLGASNIFFLDGILVPDTRTLVIDLPRIPNSKDKLQPQRRDSQALQRTRGTVLVPFED